MRMRKKKNGATRLAACSEYLFDLPSSPLCDPAGELGVAGAPVWLEIGAGKGGFAVGMVKANPTVAYYAMERVSDCVTLAAELAKREDMPRSLRFVVDTADNLTRLFAYGSIDRIFLNFSDPWSKKGYAKRRLTHRRYLAVYMNLLKDGGSLTFKTDNVGLFDFTLEEIEAMGLKPVALTGDLHASEYNEGNVMTEYERAFSSEGVKINMVRVEKPKGFSPEIEPSLLPDRKIFVREDY